MKLVLSFALVFCAIWESEQLFHLVEPGLYAGGHRIKGDEIIYEKCYAFHYDVTGIDVFYPHKSAPVSFYKITRIELKDYGGNYHVTIDDDINSYRTKLGIDNKVKNMDLRNISWTMQINSS